MQDVLANLLLSSRAVAQMVGSNVDWDATPQGATGPRIVMHLISDPRRYTMSGPVQVYATRVQIDSIAKTAVQRRALAERVDALLSGYRGGFGGILLKGVFAAGVRDRFDTAEADVWFTRQADYIFHWAPAQP